MPIELYDNTLPGSAIYIDDTGKVGFACLPDATHPVSVFGTPFIDNNGRFPNGACDSNAVAPFISTNIPVPAGGSTDVTLSVSNQPIGTSDPGCDAEMIGGNTVRIRNRSGLEAKLAMLAMW